METPQHIGKTLEAQITSQVGGSQLSKTNAITLSSYREQLEAEHATKLARMRESYLNEVKSMVAYKENKCKELEKMAEIVKLNSSILANKQNPAIKVDNTALLSVTEYLTSLNSQNALQSLPIAKWRAEFGDARFVDFMRDMLYYFLSQFNVKENLTEVQLTQLTMQIVTAMPNTRMKELLLILRNATEGKYGSTYQRIGVDTVFGWVNQYHIQASIEHEAAVMAENPTEKQGAAPWIQKDRELEQYKQDAAAKADINQKAFERAKKDN